MSDAKKRAEKGQEDQWTISTVRILCPLKGPGSRIGQFEVEHEIGRGGMGVVYLARDMKLGREVALKSLPRESMDDPDIRSRLSREAKVLASLNHPNIATLHDIVEEDDGSPFLVLEYVPGKSLREQIEGAGIKPQKALSIALEIAEAVSAAHEHNVIHRDLKPGNIKITAEGRVKVLDFGLAKTVCAGDLDQSSSVTQPGRIMGTPDYMSPEQARGQETDKRCDIWAFGCVLYEMLTGEAPFRAGTVSDTLAAVLDREPDWQALPKTTPANIRILLRRCLEKEPNRRLHDMADAVIEIRETLSGTLEAVSVSIDAAAVSLRTKVVFTVLAGLTAVALLASAVLLTRSRSVASKPAKVSRLSIALPAEFPLYTGAAPNRFVAISPDGTELVYVGRSTNGDSELYVRSLGSLHITTIRGTRDAHNPFFSPDGNYVGFFTSKQLKKVNLAGGEPSLLLDGLQLGEVAFGSWADDGTIVFCDRAGLKRISEDGSPEAEMLVPCESASDTQYYCYPQVLPSGAILYSRVDSTASRSSAIEAYVPRTGKGQRVLDNATYGSYVDSGHLIFVRDNVLWAVRFDVGLLKPTSKEVPLARDDVGFDYTDLTPQITVSANGTMAYALPPRLRKKELVWVDKKGKATPLVADAEAYEGPRLSPDGKLIAVGIRSPNEDNIQVSIYDTQLQRFNPLMTAGESNYARWSPNGTQIAFWGRTDKSAEAALYCRDIASGNSVKLLANRPGAGIFLHPYSWSKTLLACTVRDPNTGEDIWILDLEGNQDARPIIQTPQDEYNPELSPDGCWLAYVSHESGQPQIYVSSYPDLDRTWVVRTPEAANPAWSSDGRRLFYVSGNKMMAVAFTPGSAFPIGRPEKLFESSQLAVSGGRLERNYDVFDDERFLMLMWPDNSEDSLIVVQNWFEELKQLGSVE